MDTQPFTYKKAGARTDGIHCNPEGVVSLSRSKNCHDINDVQEHLMLSEVKVLYESAFSGKWYGSAERITKRTATIKYQWTRYLVNITNSAS
jgi:hypothetical protein